MEQRKIILIGKTGDGKSSTGNTILRKEAFTPKASANAVTTKSVVMDGMVDGRKITVIDTPGLFDTDRNDMEIKSEIMKALIECSPGIDAFVLVLEVGRYTRHENEVFQQFLNTLKEDALKHTVILFTFGDQLEGQTIKEFVKANSQLQEVVDKCGGRCHVIDNKHWKNCHSEDNSNRVQVTDLMETIDKMVKDNGCYSNELLQMLEEKIQEEMKINEDNLPQEEKREKAKKTVHKKIMVQVAGAATGVLIGALLGLGVALASIVNVLQQFCPLKELMKAKIAAETGVVAGGARAAAAGGAGEAAEAAGAAAGGAGAAAGAAGAAAGGAGAAAAGGAGAAAGAAGAAAGGARAAAGAAGVAGAAAGGARAAVGGGISASTIAAYAVGAVAFAGAVGGGITGWKAAEDADSVSDAIQKSATANYENAKTVVEKTKELVELALNKKI